MRWILSIILLAPVLSLTAQENEPSVKDQLEAIELELDSLLIYHLIDSLFSVDASSSEIGVRLGYSSSRLSAGRDFNLNQQGYSPGLSYYHKSGIYGDWSTYFDNQSEGAINLSILHGGYMWMPSSKWMINPYIEKTFNHQPSSNELTQSVGSSFTYDFKVAEISMDYSFLWGQSTGHRIIPSLSKTVSIKNFPLLGDVNLYPNISLLAGSTTIFNYLFSDQEVENYLLQVQDLSISEIRALRVSGQITTEEARLLWLGKAALWSDDSEAIELFSDWLNTIEEDQAFALLNVNISLPVSFKIKKTGVMMSYSYSIPQRLPGEDLGVDPSGFFSLSISRRFNL